MTKTMIKTMSVTVGDRAGGGDPAAGDGLRPTPATSPIATPWSRSTSVISTSARPRAGRRRAWRPARPSSAARRATPAASRPSRRPSRTPRSPCRRAAKGQHQTRDSGGGKTKKTMIETMERCLRGRCSRRRSCCWRHGIGQLQRRRRSAEPGRRKNERHLAGGSAKSRPPQSLEARKGSNAEGGRPQRHLGHREGSPERQVQPAVARLKGRRKVRRRSPNGAAFFLRPRLPSGPQHGATASPGPAQHPGHANRQHHEDARGLAGAVAGGGTFHRPHKT